LRKGDYAKVDWQNILEEIETLGRAEKRFLRQDLTILLMHMLKVKYQPHMHSRSWDLSIKNSRLDVKRTLKENPSLKSKFSASNI